MERQLTPDAVKALYEVYAEAFDPLRANAAARHLLTVDEFTAEMLDERIDKYVVWRDDGRPAALTTVTTDLSAVSWISPEFYTTRFPDHAARDAIFYLGYTLVHPDLEGEGITARIIARLVQRMHRAAAVCAFDVAEHNDDTHGIGAKIAKLGRRRPMDFMTVDRQSYYAAVFHGPDAAPVARPGPGEAAAPAAMRTVPLAERPDLAAAVPGVLGSRWPTFMLAGHPGHGVDLTELLAGAAAHQILLLDPDDHVVGVGLSVPMTWDGTVAGLPAGWDGAVAASAELMSTGGTPTMVSALSVTLAPAAAGQGHAAGLVQAMKRAAVQIGAPGLLAPVRPVWKPRYPLVSLRDYAAWRNGDGQVFDPWLRLHLELGARVLGIADVSLTVTGTVAEWQEWTGVALPGSGHHIIPGGLVPLQVDVQTGQCVYREPNIWVLHPAG